MKSNTQLLTAILKEIDDTISILEKETEERWPKDTKFKVGDQLPEMDFKNMDSKSLLKYQEGHGIKYNGNWTKKYIEEALNSRYGFIAAHVIGNLKILKQNIKKEFDIFSLESINGLIKKKIKENHKLIKSDHGNLYYDEDYRKENKRLLKDRFDAFWFICEWSTLRPLPPKKRNVFNSATNSDYPFIIVDLVKWGDFEQAYWTIPLLKKLHSLVCNQSSLELEKCPFKEPTTIFNENGEDILFTILIKSGVVTKIDYNKVQLTTKFRGACNHLYEILKRPSINVLRTISKTEFIKYLNNENGYDAKIPNPQKSKIADETTTYNASQLVDPVLVEIFPNLTSI